MTTRIEELYDRKAYSPEASLKIEEMGSMAVSVANRWMLGWPARVTALLKAGTYLDSLESQVDQEKFILANEASFRHLARREILELHEIKESPPCLI
jgi:hypothetical protein